MRLDVARGKEGVSNPPMSVTLGGVKGNEGVIQPTNVGDFGGAWKNGVMQPPDVGKFWGSMEK